MTQAQPAVPDAQSRDNPIEVPEEQPRPVATMPVVCAMVAGEPIFDLEHQVQTSGVIKRPDAVCVTQPTGTRWWLRVTVSRPKPGGRPEDTDVVQHGYQLYKAAELLPEAWFESGDLVDVERTHPFEPRPPVAAADQPPGWLNAGQGTGNFIYRRGR